MNDTTLQTLDDGTLRFLPNRLNNQPVIIGGLTADEMWATLAVTSGVGFAVGLPLAFVITPAMPVLCALLFGATGLGVAARLLRRWKRGRPETWLGRQMQWQLGLHGFNPAKLITRSGTWTCKRGVP